MIGVDRYSRGWIPLARAVSDAKAVAAHLEKRGFKVVLLLDEEATRDKIAWYIEDHFPKLLQTNDRFVLYFAGHGQDILTKRTTKRTGYIVPVGGSRLEGRHHLNTYLSMKYVESVLVDNISAKHVLVVLDSCFSGLLGLRGGGGIPATLSSSLRKLGITFVAAGESDQVARDGLFTAVLLEALAGSSADSDDDGYISAIELGFYLRQQVPRQSTHTQQPIFGNLSGEGQLLFRRLPQTFVVDRDPATESIAEPQASTKFSERERLLLSYWSVSEIPEISTDLLGQFDSKISSLEAQRREHPTNPGTLDTLAAEVERALRRFEAPPPSEILDYAFAVLSHAVRERLHKETLASALQLVESYQLPITPPRFPSARFATVRDLVGRFPLKSLSPATQLRIAETYYEEDDLAAAAQILRSICAPEAVDLLGARSGARALLLAAETGIRNGSFARAREYLSTLRRFGEEPWSTLGLMYLLILELRGGAWADAMTVVQRMGLDVDPAGAGFPALPIIREARHRVAQVLAHQTQDPDRHLETIEAALDDLPGGLSLWAGDLWYWLGSHDYYELAARSIDRDRDNEASVEHCQWLENAGHSDAAVNVPAWMACAELLKPGSPTSDRSGRLAARQDLDALAAKFLLNSANWLYDDCAQYFHSSECLSRALTVSLRSLERYSADRSMCGPLRVASSAAWQLGDSDIAEPLLRRLAENADCSLEHRQEAAESLISLQLGRWERSHGTPLLIIEGHDQETYWKQLDLLILGDVVQSSDTEDQFRRDASRALALLDKHLDSEMYRWVFGALLARNGQFTQAAGVLAPLENADAAYFQFLMARQKGGTAFGNAWEKSLGWDDDVTLLGLATHHAELALAEHPENGDNIALFLFRKLQLLANILDDDRCQNLRIRERLIPLGVYPLLPQIDIVKEWSRLAIELYLTRDVPDCASSGWSLLPVAMDTAIVSGDLDAMGEVLEATFALADGHPEGEGYALQVLEALATALRVDLPEVSGRLDRILEAEKTWRCGPEYPVRTSYAEISLRGSSERILLWCDQADPALSGYEEAAMLLRKACGINQAQGRLSGKEPYRMQRSLGRRKALRRCRESEDTETCCRETKRQLPSELWTEWEGTRDTLDILKAVMETHDRLVDTCLVEYSREWPFRVHADLQWNQDDSANFTIRPQASDRIADALIAGLFGTSSDLEKACAKLSVCLLKKLGRDEEASDIHARYFPGEFQRKQRKVARMRLGSVSASGFCSLSDVQQVIEKHKGAIDTCFSGIWQHAVRLEKNIILLKFVIGLNGKIRGVTALRDEIGFSPTTRCVRRVFNRMRFPKPKGGICIVRLPVRPSTEALLPPVLPPISRTFCLTHKDRLFQSDSPAGDWMYLVRCAHRFDSRILEAPRRLVDLPAKTFKVYWSLFRFGPLRMLAQ